MPYNTGIILCEQYLANVNGEMFAQFVKDHTNQTFKNSVNAKGKLFLQDGDSNQNSKKATVALRSIDCNKFPIPPICADMNPIENIFNITKKQLHADALSKNITFDEHFEQYSKCVIETLLSLPVKTINKTTTSMLWRMEMIFKGNIFVLQQSHGLFKSCEDCVQLVLGGDGSLQFSTISYEAIS